MGKKYTWEYTYFLGWVVGTYVFISFIYMYTHTHTTLFYLNERLHKDVQSKKTLWSTVCHLRFWYSRNVSTIRSSSFNFTDSFSEREIGIEVSIQLKLHKEQKQQKSMLQVNFSYLHMLWWSLCRYLSVPPSDRKCHWQCFWIYSKIHLCFYQIVLVHPLSFWKKTLQNK